MKKAILIFALLLGASTMNAQNAKPTATGNYVAFRAIDTTASKPTGKTFTDAKGVVFPVFISKNGKLFINKISKAGNAYKMYLKLDGAEG